MIELQQQDWDGLYQAHKNLFVRIDLYEYVPDENDVFTFRKLDEISGVVLTGNVTEDAESEVRRTADLNIHVLNSTFTLGEDTKIWLNKYLSLYIGYEEVKTGEMLWYHLGLLEMLNVNYSYNSTEQTLSLNLSDMTVSLDGTKSGEILGANPKFPADEVSIKRAIEDTLAQLGNWHLYLVDNIGEYGYENVTTKNRIPYTMEWIRPVTVYDIIKDLRDLYPGYESYFEKDGTFRVRRIPTCMNDPVVMTYEQIKPLVISESNNGVDFESVRNVTEVLGKDYDTGGYFTHIVTGSGGNYKGDFESFTFPGIEENEYFSFIPNHTNSGSCTLQVNDLTPMPIQMYVPNVGNKEIPPGFIQEGMPIIVKCMPGDQNRLRFLYLGRTQIKGVYILVSKQRDWRGQQYDIQLYNTQNIKYGINPDSPFTIDKIGRKSQVCASNQYDLIETEIGALERAEYETWLKNNMAYSITLTTTLIPWLEVNQKISYKSPLEDLQRRELGFDDDDNDGIPQYIIKRITRSLSDGTQTMELTRFYNLYPWIISGTSVYV